MIVLSIILFLLIILIAVFASSRSGTLFEPPNRVAGRRGEQYATSVIRSVLHDDDLLFTNIQISFQDNPAELDNVIVNKNGVFIIEIKNYSGTLVGTEEDYEWKKYHMSEGGNTYEKTVKNPIRQVKRQVYILAKYLDRYGISAWVDGYAVILRGRTDISSPFLLEDVADIGRIIHSRGKTALNQATIAAIKDLLTES